MTPKERDRFERLLNPWTIEIQSTDGDWEEFCHDAPLTLADAEVRMREHQQESPEAVFHVRPWFNLSQRQIVNRLRETNRELVEVLSATECAFCAVRHGDEAWEGHSCNQCTDARALLLRVKQ
jgi:hypothetical protein